MRKLTVYIEGIKVIEEHALIKTTDIIRMLNNTLKSYLIKIFQTFLTDWSSDELCFF